MHPIFQFLCQYRVDFPLPFHPPYSFERARHDPHAEMCLTFGARAGMTGMTCAFVFDDKFIGRERKR